MFAPSSPAIRSVSLSLRDHATCHDRLTRARVRALRSVAIELASRSPRCFCGRVARRRLGSCPNRAPVLHSTKLWSLLDENTLAMSRKSAPFTRNVKGPAPTKSLRLKVSAWCAVCGQQGALTNAAMRGHNEFASQDPLLCPSGGTGRRARFRV